MRFVWLHKWTKNNMIDYYWGETSSLFAQKVCGCGWMFVNMGNACSGVKKCGIGFFFFLPCGILVQEACPPFAGHRNQCQRHLVGCCSEIYFFFLCLLLFFFLSFVVGLCLKKVFVRFFLFFIFLIFFFFALFFKLIFFLNKIEKKICIYTSAKDDCSAFYPSSLFFCFGSRAHTHRHWFYFYKKKIKKDKTHHIKEKKKEKNT